MFVRFIITFVFVLTASFSQFLSANVIKGDTFFENEQYEQAQAEYLKSAEIGSAHAFYQLGVMSLKGLGQEADYSRAVIWFSLAAEYEFADSQQILAQIYEGLDADLVSQLQSQVAAVLKEYGKTQVEQVYFPQVLSENNELAISFTSGEGLSGLYDQVNDDEIFAPEIEQEAIPQGDINGFLGEEDGFESLDATLDASQQAPSFNNPVRDLPFLAIVDYQLAPDGSVRNIVPVQTIGNTRLALDNLAHETQAPAVFADKPTWFTQRTHLGMARLDKNTFRERHSYLYSRIRRLATRKKQSTELEDQYQYAMTLLHFPWLPQEQGEALEVLKQTAQAGHPVAQYEYGLELYRQQQKVPEAIHWIASASKYGLRQAEYFIGSLLLTSPWVEKDELKALHWFELAAQQDFTPAYLSAAELRLTIADESVRDLQTALAYLDKAEKMSVNNPQYYYLRALTLRHKDNRNLKLAFDNMRRAIQVGNNYNWDTSQWDAQLQQWMQGRILVTDFENQGATE